ncbi:MAG TPA: DUF433 domain-containing protein [Chloroflexota bacterium]|nr:DUF433 domain-containing protein [Chloroflexota bacterium]
MAEAYSLPFPRIVRNPRVLSGEPTVSGTRVSVRVIVETLRQDGDIASLLDAFPRLTREDIEDALAFYEANRAEIDHYIQENEDALA